MIQLLIGFIALIAALIGLIIVFYTIGLPILRLLNKEWEFKAYGESVFVGILVVIIFLILFYIGRNLMGLGQVISEIFNL